MGEGPDPALRPPRPAGLLLSCTWLLVVVFACLLFLAACEVWSVTEPGTLGRHLAWWLAAAGAATTTIAATWLVIVMRLRRIARERGH